MRDLRNVTRSARIGREEHVGEVSRLLICWIWPAACRRLALNYLLSVNDWLQLLLAYVLKDGVYQWLLGSLFCLEVAQLIDLASNYLRRIGAQVLKQ